MHIPVHKLCIFSKFSYFSANYLYFPSFKGSSSIVYSQWNQLLKHICKEKQNSSNKVMGMHEVYTAHCQPNLPNSTQLNLDTVRSFYLGFPFFGLNAQYSET